MKKILFTLLFLIAFFAGYSQMNNNGGNITVETGATLVIEGNYTSTSNGILEVDGLVQLKGNFINTSGTIATGSTGRLAFAGTSPQQISGAQSTTFYCAVEVNNGSGVALTNTSTGANQFLDSTLILTSGKVTLNNFNLTLSNEGATVSGTSSYVVADSTGQLRAGVGNSNYTFPVGTASSYNPLILREYGTADTFGVIYKGTLPGAWTGGLPHTVLGHWTVSEKTLGGNDLAATAQWNAGQEQASFDRTDCAVGVTADNGATVAWKASGAAIANGSAWTRIGGGGGGGAGFSTVGKFMVGDYFFEGIDLDLDVFLAGPYSAGTMSTALLSNSQIPLSDPYGNSTTVGAIPANTVDWIEVQLRDSGTPSTIVKKYSVFLDNSGNVLNTNGNVGTKLTGVAKASYYVAVRHRNHLGAMTASTINFTTGGPSYAFDFSAGALIYGTNPMRNMGTKWALWAGNADGNTGNTVVNFGAAPSDITPVSNAVLTDPGNPSSNPLWFGPATYSYADCDMNAFVQFGSAPSDITPISSSVLNNPANGSSNPLMTLSQQLP
jgi:hypothetical protein